MHWFGAACRSGRPNSTAASADSDANSTTRSSIAANRFANWRSCSDRPAGSIAADGFGAVGTAVAGSAGALACCSSAVRRASN